MGIKEMSNEEFISYLGRLGTDCHESGKEATADDYHEASKRIRELSQQVGDMIRFPNPPSADPWEDHSDFISLLLNWRLHRIVSEPPWHPPVLRPFQQEDWNNYAGCESDNPQIANVRIEGISGDLVVEECQVCLYFSSIEDERFYVRDFGNKDNDAFLKSCDLGLLFSDWLVKAFRETTTFAELETDFGFKRV